MLGVLLAVFIVLTGTTLFPIQKMKKINIVKELKYE